MRPATTLLLVLALLPGRISAAEVTAFSPTGVVKDVRQATARFSEPVVKFGDPRLPDPFDIECSASGHGHWLDGRNWVYDFEADLPAGIVCTFTLKDGLKTLAGHSLDGQQAYTVATGGPSVRSSMPSEDWPVDENQVFLFALDAVATKASIEKHAYCAVSDPAERIPLRVLEGREREEVLAQRRQLGYAYYRLLLEDGWQGGAPITADALKQAEGNIVAARCARPLPSGATLDIVWGKSVATPSGVTAASDRVLRYLVRQAFTATFSCARVNADSACVPVLPMRLHFSAPVARELALQVRLTGAGSGKPRLDSDNEPFVERLTFEAPFPAATKLAVTLPQGFADDAGRPLANASSFPLAVATDEAPPLAKFAAEFGILELQEGGVLPVTIRGIEDHPRSAKIGGRAQRIDSEADILAWMQRVEKAMAPRWEEDTLIQPGRESVFGPDDDAETFQLPEHEGGKAFEVIGIPLTEPGFHVVEIASPRLGQALLGEDRLRYVATTALVTNLAVHFKWGREGSLVWVTALDSGAPVAAAAVTIVDGCDGRKTWWQGRTGADGSVRIDSGLPEPTGWTGCDRNSPHPLLISARHGDDHSFTLTGWNEGITPGDFQVDIGTWQAPQIAHTVLDRALFRAGETVSMKHFWREHTATGLAVPAHKPGKLVVAHPASDTTIELPVSFDASGIAESQWQIPQEARLGEYTIRLEAGTRSHATGSFRVEQYRVPLMRAVITPPAEPAVAAAKLPLDLFVGYFSGGGAAGLQVKLRTQVRARAVRFKDYEDFVFDGETLQAGIVEGEGGGFLPDEGDDTAHKPMPAQTLPLTLDANGSAHTEVPDLPLAPDAQEVFAELEYPDANGELTSVRTVTPVWPADVVVGLTRDTWGGTSADLHFQAVVLDLDGRPVADHPVAVQLWSRETHSYRKRLVGGFYAYSNSVETQKLDSTCRGRTDAQGLLSCTVAPGVSGEVLLEATAADAAGRVSRAVSRHWVAGTGDWWFAQTDNDRMDLIPATREVEPGAKLELQVRMPFRSATALVTIEREGVMRAFVTELSGREPVIEVPMEGVDAPNVYVSVLAVRPRVGDFRSRFYDFLRWLGLDRWFELDGGRPTAMVDLSKPAFRLGLTRVDVGWTAHRLKVDVTPGQQTYQTRGKALVEVEVTPAAGGALPADAEIAFAAIDEALLDLRANPSIDVLDRMMQRRGTEVFTSTAQLQVVGKRHYGRKSLPPGGGGGRGAAREMQDSLLLWQGRVPLDANGHATVEVPLNDALSAFRLTAIAHAGADRFGTGAATIRTTQDVQLLSGLAPLVRENDQFDALFTIRNTTREPKEIALEAEAVGEGLSEPLLREVQTLTVPANGAAPARFEAVAPVDSARLTWTVRARSRTGEPYDALKVGQDVVPAFPVRVYQATLTQLDGNSETPVERPAGAIAGRGGVRVDLQATLAASLAPVQDWMRLYPYQCFEQDASRGIVLDDRALWDRQMAKLPAYLDGDGLVRYFPSNWLQGSDTLTAYLLAIAAESGFEIPEPQRGAMLEGLASYVQGRVQRPTPLSQQHQTERKLAALDALSRYGWARPEWLTTIAVDPDLWHTSALIDWIGILTRVADAPDRAKHLEEAKAILRSRLDFQGTRMGFSTEQDDALWWLMVTPDVNANRAILALLDDPAWREELPRMMRGAIGRQQAGHWNVTTANAWGALATRKFVAQYEHTPVRGTTVASLDAVDARHDWATPEATPLDLPWPDGKGVLRLAHAGSGRPWAIVQSRAALSPSAPMASGYRITRTVTPVEPRPDGEWRRGDTVRVKLEIDAQADMTWVVVEDPVPGGATILGGGLGRDSALMTQGETRTGAAWPAFEERRFDFFRAYYAFVPKGTFSLEYTVRYNNAGRFTMPATRAEAMYAPEMFGEHPNEPVVVEASP